MRGQYPNPDAVVYGTTLPPRFPCQLTTNDTGRNYPMHNHGAWIDTEGNGNTDVAAGHFHRIRDGRVLPDESDGHIHALTTLACGAGAPINVPRDPDSRLTPFAGSYLGAPASGGGHRTLWIVLGIVGLAAVGTAAYLVYRSHE